MFLLLIIAIIKTDITYTRDKPLSKMHHIVKVYPVAGLRQTDRYNTCVAGGGGRKRGSVSKSCANFNFTSCSSVTNQVRLCCAVCHKQQQQQQFVCLLPLSVQCCQHIYLLVMRATVVAPTTPSSFCSFLPLCLCKLSGSYFSRNSSAASRAHINKNGL